MCGCLLLDLRRHTVAGSELANQLGNDVVVFSEGDDGASLATAATLAVGAAALACLGLKLVSADWRCKKKTVRRCDPDTLAPGQRRGARLEA